MPQQIVVRLGPVHTLEDIKKIVSDLQVWIDSINTLLQPVLISASPVAAKVLLLEPDGMIHLWTLEAGSGTTVNYDTATRTIEITSP